jgi:hypothetical protein
MPDDKKAQPPKEAEQQAQNTIYDEELEEYRGLLENPEEFEEGFTWISVAGALFCGLLMFPGAIYLGLLSGFGLNQAAMWVTVILFSEIMRRALKAMSRGEMVILLSVAGAMIGGSAAVPGGPFGQLIWRQYFATSDAVKDVGIYGELPEWWIPKPDSEAITNRTFFHIDWLAPILLMLYMTVNSFVDHWTAGYALFRLTSDVENLPFPMAPVGAQGVMALAEGESGDRTWRWTAFSIGAVLGLGYGAIQVGVPAFSSAFLEKPIMVIPLPWFELTPVTEGVLPAVPTGIILDLGLVLMGFVIPFWAVMGSLVSVLITFAVNPLLHHAGILTTWHPGMDTIDTQIANKIDFFFSAELGLSLGIAIVSIFQTVRQVRYSMKNLKEKREQLERQNLNKEGVATSIWEPPKGRGDWPLWLCFAGYFLSAGTQICLIAYLIPEFRTGFFLAWLVLFAFVYTPLVSYLNARIIGIAGQHLEIPFVREGFILLSGYQGVDIWCAPIPLENYGGLSQGLRTVELTGVKFTSKIKAWFLTKPLVFILSLIFWSFLWADGPIPSDMYPFAQKMWKLRANNQVIMWSSTSGATDTLTLFERSFDATYLGVGVAFAVIVFSILSFFGLPTMLIYGVARGLSQGQPHGLILEIFGALLARYYFHRKYGRKPFLKTAPVLLAGYMVGTGLIGMGAVAIRLISSAISMTPF